MYALSICLSRAHHSRRCLQSHHAIPFQNQLLQSTFLSKAILRKSFHELLSQTLYSLSFSLSLSLHKAPPESPARPPALQKILRIHIRGLIFFTNRVNLLRKECSFSGSPGEGRQSILLQRIPHQPRLCGSIVIKALIFAPKKPFHPWIAERCNQRNSTSTLHVG